MHLLALRAPPPLSSAQLRKCRSILPVSSFELENLGKATGWTTDQLRNSKQIGPRIGTTTAAMAEGAKNVASIFQTMNKSQVGLTFERSELFEKLKDPNTVAAIERLRNLKPQQQIEGLEHIAEGIRSPADRRDFYKALGLPEEMASASADELKKYSEEIKKNLGTIPEIINRSRRQSGACVDRFQGEIAGRCELHRFGICADVRMR